MYALLTPYAKEHPEFYPLNKKGDRKPNRLHFCYTSPGISEALADALSKQIEKRKGGVNNIIYFAGMGDWYGGMCLCPRCKKTYQEETWTDPDSRKKPGYSATLLQMINTTAEILEKKYPGIQVGTFAYMSLEAPPLRTLPRKNVIIRLPRLRHCTVHPARTCPLNRSFLRNLERWCELAPGRVYIWDYGANFKNFVFPFPCIRSIADNIRLYAKLGVKGIRIQGNYVTTGSDLVVLKNHLWRKLLWNPKLDTDELIEEFCKGYYGPASSGMLEYVKTLEDAVRTPQAVHANEFSRPTHLSEEVRKELLKLRRKAIESTGGQEPYLRRVCEGTVGIEALLLAGAGPRKDSRGRYLRKDGFVLWSRVKEYSFERACKVLQYVRSSGVNEWTSGLSFWRSFLAQHAIYGSKLITFERGDVKIVISPAWKGQIRQIIFKGQKLLAPTQSEKQIIGGSLVDFGKPFMRILKKSTDEVEMDDALPIPNWRFRYPATITKSINLQEDGTIIVRASVLKKTKPQPARVITVYDVTRPGDFEVLYLSDEGWKELDLTSSATIPEFSALKIVLKNKGCAVVDTYLSPDSHGGMITFYRKSSTLTTVVHTSEIGSEGFGTGGTFEREIRVSPFTAK